jgi:hypothetical protein
MTQMRNSKFFQENRSPYAMGLVKLIFKGNSVIYGSRPVYVIWTLSYLHYRFEDPNGFKLALHLTLYCYLIYSSCFVAMFDMTGWWHQNKQMQTTVFKFCILWCLIIRQLINIKFTLITIDTASMIINAFIEILLHLSTSHSNIWWYTNQKLYYWTVILLTYLRSWALLEEPPIVQPLKKFPAFYGTRRFNTVFTRALQWSLSWAISIQSYVLVFPVVSFLLAFPPISYMHSFSLSFVLHAPPISSFFTWLF